VVHSFPTACAGRRPIGLDVTLALGTHLCLQSSRRRPQEPAL